MKSFHWPLHYSDRGGDLAIFLRGKAIFFYSFERQFLISHLQFFRECFVPIIKITTNVQRNGKNANIRNTNSSFKSSGKFNILVSWVIGTSIFISILLCLRQIHGNTMLSLVLHSKNSQLKKKKSVLRNANGTVLVSSMGLLQLRFGHGTMYIYINLACVHFCACNIGKIKNKYVRTEQSVNVQGLEHSWFWYSQIITNIQNQLHNNTISCQVPIKKITMLAWSIEETEKIFFM